MMQQYQTNSRKKHFYTCQLCSLVYITLQALQKHYSDAHPQLSCDVEEYEESDSYEDPIEDYKSDNHLSTFREDISFYNNNNNFNNNDNILENSTILKNNSNNNNNDNGVSDDLDSSIRFTHLTTSNTSSVQTLNSNNNKKKKNPQGSLSRNSNSNKKKVNSQQQNGKFAKKSTPNLSSTATLISPPAQTTILAPSLVLQQSTNIINSNVSNPQITYTNIQLKTINNNSIQQQTNSANQVLNVDLKNNNNKLRCDICNKTFVNMYNKRRHYEMVHNQILLKTTSSSTLTDLDPHQQQQRIPVQLVQTFVPTLTSNPFGTSTQSVLISNTETNPVMMAVNNAVTLQHNLSNEKDNKKTIICNICNKTFSTTYNKRRHDEMVHGQNTGTRIVPKYKCSSCEKVFSSIYNKTRHENIHKPINERLKHICPKCNKGFTTTFILKSHMQKIHQIL